ncbi:MAG: methyl-accepting chemotaxis protein, partial [Planctomycetota bacterium]
MTRLADVSLKIKIWAGFAAVTLLLVGVAFTGWRGISTAATGFTRYRELARDSNLCGSLQANMLMVRMKAKDFVISSSQDAIDAYDDYFAKTAGFLEDAQREINDPTRAAKVDYVQELLDQYGSTFQRAVAVQADRNAVLADRLNRFGPQSERLLTAITESARDDNDTSASYRAGAAMRRLLLGRLYVVKYFDSQADSDQQRAREEFAALDRELASLNAELQDPTCRANLAE